MLTIRAKEPFICSAYNYKAQYHSSHWHMARINKPIDHECLCLLQVVIWSGKGWHYRHGQPCVFPPPRHHRFPGSKKGWSSRSAGCYLIFTPAPLGALCHLWEAIVDIGLGPNGSFSVLSFPYRLWWSIDGHHRIQWVAPPPLSHTFRSE